MTTRYDVISDPTASKWLKKCLTDSRDLDKVQLVNDVSVLADILAEESMQHLQYLQHQIDQIKNNKMVDFEMLECELR